MKWVLKLAILDIKINFKWYISVKEESNRQKNLICSRKNKDDDLKNYNIEISTVYMITVSEA